MINIFTPVFEPHYFDVKRYSWLIEYPKEEYDLVELTENISEGKIGLLIGTLLEFNNSELDDNFLSALTQKDEISLCGGLRISKSGKFINPSCCSDFQDWREWELFLNGDINGVWLGHDPEPWVEMDNNEINIWSDLDKNPSKFKISSTISEIEFSLKKVEIELLSVSKIIDDWAKKNLNTEYAKFKDSIEKYLMVR
ncbi:hypothetical protein [uncultured Desulfobacter sp.]|uniref:hypothetical protein n=1 Tax=uncultured Desulfobacter sp. TaxID=240139 RepID=UPI002AA92DB0|nr:hypothetical protein [uncultured Desulfobacter sp.]